MASPKIAIVWRGDREARRNATPANNRFHRVFEELAAVGIDAEPAVYDEAFADEVRAQLLQADGVLVWVNPLQDGIKTREALDPLLREVAERGPWVSAHPDVILKMGVKEVLYRTRHLGWGTDTHLYRSAAEFRDAFPARLAQSGPRVLKQNRGNDGQGVWKVERRRAATATRCACCTRCAAASRKNCRSHLHEPLRGLFRLGRLHHRPAVPAPPAGRHDPLLHGRRSGCGLWPSIHQGADRAAAGGPGLAGGAAGATHHARAGGRAVSGAAGENGNANGCRR